jgi:hypothetical protein
MLHLRKDQPNEIAFFYVTSSDFVWRHDVTWREGTRASGLTWERASRLGDSNLRPFDGQICVRSWRQIAIFVRNFPRKSFDLKGASPYPFCEFWKQSKVPSCQIQHVIGIHT